MAIARSAPAAEVMTSNQASTASSVAVAMAASRYRASRRSSSRPVAARPSASRLSSPVQAAAQCAARALPGSSIASPASHGIMPSPATSMTRPSQRAGHRLTRSIRVTRVEGALAGGSPAGGSPAGGWLAGGSPAGS
jgi:hypothetical protein